MHGKEHLWIILNPLSSLLSARDGTRKPRLQVIPNKRKLVLDTKTKKGSNSKQHKKREMDEGIHIDVSTWLRTIGMDHDDYRMIFGRFIGVQSLLHLTEQDIYDLGIENAAHRAKIVTSLIVIKAQIEKRLGLRKSNQHVGGNGSPSVTYDPTDYAQLNVTSSPSSDKMALVRSPSFNIDNHPWYHGHISRDNAESIVQKDGDFLVRNSVSNPGDYVLTCKHRGKVWHFLVNRQIETGGKYSKVKYQFEDSLFDSVPGLVNFYVTCKSPISQASGAIITRPIRKIDVPQEMTKRPLPPTPENPVDRTVSMPPKQKPPLRMQRSTSDSNMMRPTNFDSHLRRTSPQRVLKKSKPVIPIRNTDLYEDDGKDYSDYSQVKATPQIILEARRRRNEGLTSPLTSPVTQSFPKSDELSPNDGYGKIVSQAEAFKTMKTNNNGMLLPDLESKSAFRTLDFENNFLKANNKPLDTATIIAIKTALLGSDVECLAKHFTAVDMELLNVVKQKDMGVCVTSGLEHITLPQGHQLRQDVLERYQSLRVFIVLTILTCPQLAERALMLNRWIEIAAELKQKMGNLMSFAIILESLAHPAVTRLRRTWLQVHQEYSQTLYTLKNKLRPFMQQLHTGLSPLPLENVSIPYILPVVELLERPLNDTSNLCSWESDGLECLETVLLHFDTARLITNNSFLYRTKGEEILDSFEMKEEVYDVFKTEVHMRLCWGYRGWEVKREERIAKFSQILTMLSQKTEPSTSESATF